MARHRIPRIFAARAKERLSDAGFRGVLRGIGLTEGQVAGIAGMSAGLAEGFVAENPRTVATTTPTTSAARAAAHLSA